MEEIKMEAVTVFPKNCDDKTKEIITESMDELLKKLNTFINGNDDIKRLFEVEKRKELLSFLQEIKKQRESGMLSELEFNQLLGSDYETCPNCDKKMYYFNDYERFCCPDCLYTTEKISLIRTKKKEDGK